MSRHRKLIAVNRQMRRFVPALKNSLPAARVVITPAVSPIRRAGYRADRRLGLPDEELGWIHQVEVDMVGLELLVVVVVVGASTAMVATTPLAPWSDVDPR